MLGISVQVWNLLLPSFFSHTDFFPCPIKRSCTCIHNPHSKQNAPEWWENYCFHNSHLLVQSTSEVFSPRYWAFFSTSLNKFFTQRVDKTIPSFKSYHVCPPFFLLFHYFPLSSASTSLWLVDGAIPAYGSSPFFAVIPIIFPGFLLGSFIFCFWRPDRAFSWGLAAPPYPWPAPGWRQTCKYHCDCNGK